MLTMSTLEALLHDNRLAVLINVKCSHYIFIWNVSNVAQVLPRFLSNMKISLINITSESLSQAVH